LAAAPERRQCGAVFDDRHLAECKPVVVLEENPFPKSNPLAGVEVTQILVVADTRRSKAFWTEVLGAEVYREYESSVVLRFSGSWVLLVTGGEPTPDKPMVTFAPPAEPDRVSHAMTLRVDDCHAIYEALKERGAEFLTPPYDWGGEVRCFLRDPDGHLIELSEAN
jgi:catechol 2,3-dioxygenase-like lactoylglutathione lyase family enzyme